MKKHVFLSIAACGGLLASAGTVNAQEVVVVNEESIGVIEQPCVTRYYNSWRDGWFIQLGAGIDVPMVEDYGDSHDRHITATYNLGVGRWFTPYVGFRFSGYYGALHYADGNRLNRAKSANLNFDFMWDMFNSLGGVDLDRPVSIVPYVGLGGTFNWDFDAPDRNIVGKDGRVKSNSWTLPVSAGLQLRFRLCRYVDFFAEARASFYGDNFNNRAYGQPVDVNLTCIGGFTFNLGGKKFTAYEPCAYMAYIRNLNEQVNDLRGELAACGNALAAAQAQLPCPEVVVVDCPEQEAAPMLATVRFALDSSVITSMEQVGVYNVAEYLKANPEVKIVITGFADRDTGSAGYNKALSERRARAVYDMLVGKYGIDPSRLSVDAVGSSVQPYGVNDWNRIVIFTQD